MTGVYFAGALINYRNVARSGIEEKRGSNTLWAVHLANGIIGAITFLLIREYLVFLGIQSYLFALAVVVALVLLLGMMKLVGFKTRQI